MNNLIKKKINLKKIKSKNYLYYNYKKIYKQLIILQIKEIQLTSGFLKKKLYKYINLLFKLKKKIKNKLTNYINLNFKIISNQLINSLKENKNIILQNIKHKNIFIKKLKKKGLIIIFRKKSYQNTFFFLESYKFLYKKIIINEIFYNETCYFLIEYFLNKL